MQIGHRDRGRAERVIIGVGLVAAAARDLRDLAVGIEEARCGRAIAPGPALHRTERIVGDRGQQRRAIDRDARDLMVAVVAVDDGLAGGRDHRGPIAVAVTIADRARHGTTPWPPIRARSSASACYVPASTPSKSLNKAICSSRTCRRRNSTLFAASKNKEEQNSLADHRQ
jgi:hypothetical protein